MGPVAGPLLPNRSGKLAAVIGRDRRVKAKKKARFRGPVFAGVDCWLSLLF